MCTLTDIVKDKVFTGYKVALEDKKQRKFIQPQWDLNIKKD